MFPGTSRRIGIVRTVARAPSRRSGTEVLDYAEAGEQIGWPRLASSVQGVVDALPAQERAAAVILTANYGEAGALELLGRDLPPVFSGHNGYWDWGPPPAGSTIAIVVAGGGWRAPSVGGCTVEARFDNGLDIDNEEQGASIMVCRRVPSDWAGSWSMFRHLD